MVSIGDVLYIVKEQGIYLVKLADSIDPERLNKNIPNTQQRVLLYGSESELVGRTFLTANTLLKQKNFSSTFNCERALKSSFDAMKDIVEMYEGMMSFKLAEKKEIDAFNSREQSQGSLVMPAIGNVLERCKTYFQKADHASSNLLNIVKLFYGKAVVADGFESLAKLTMNKYGENDAFTMFVKNVAPKLQYIRNIRNSLEHPRPPSQIANIIDFNLGVDGKIAAPIMQVNYRKEKYSPVTISQFMESLVDGLSEIFETMLAHLCSKHVQNFSTFPIQVIELSEERRSKESKYVRYCYGIYIGDQIVPFG